jgi:hypothetical protein
VNVLKTMDKLIRQHQHCLEGELPIAIVEEVLQVWAKKLKHHHLEFAFMSVLMYARNSAPTSKFLVDVDFVF